MAIGIINANEEVSFNKKVERAHIITFNVCIMGPNVSTTGLKREH
jgi:hypothetical protein